MTVVVTTLAQVLDCKLNSCFDEKEIVFRRNDAQMSFGLAMREKIRCRCEKIVLGIWGIFIRIRAVFNPNIWKLDSSGIYFVAGIAKRGYT